MSKSRQSKIEQIRQESIKALSEARIQALHKGQKDTPLISEKKGMPPPPPPGAAAGASSGGGGGSPLIGPACENKAICNPGMDLLPKRYNRSIQQVGQLDGEKPTKALLDNWPAGPGGAGPLEERATIYREERDTNLKVMSEYRLGAEYNAIGTSSQYPTASEVACQPVGGVWPFGEYASTPIKDAGGMWYWHEAVTYTGPTLKGWGGAYNVKYLPAIISDDPLAALPASGNDGDAIVIVSTEGDAQMYAWRSAADPEPGWSPDGEGITITTFGADIDLSQYLAEKRSLRDSAAKTTQETALSSADLLWSQLYLPQYMLAEAGFNYQS